MPVESRRNPVRILVILSFLVFALALADAAFLFRSPSGDAAAVYFPVLAKLIDGQGAESWGPLRNGFMRTPALDLLAYSIHLVAGTNVLTTVRILLVLSGLGLLGLLYLLTARMLGRRPAFLTIWFVFAVPSFRRLNIQFLTDIPALLFFLGALYLLLYAPIRKPPVFAAAAAAAFLAVFVRPPVYVVLAAAAYPLALIFRRPRIPAKRAIVYGLIFFPLLAALDLAVAPPREASAAFDQGAWNPSFQAIALEKGSLKGAVVRHPVKFLGELLPAALVRLPWRTAADSFGQGGLWAAVLLGLALLVHKGGSERAIFAFLGVVALNWPMAAVVHYEKRYTILIYVFFSVAMAFLLVEAADFLVKRARPARPVGGTAVILALALLPFGLSARTFFEFRGALFTQERSKIPADKIFEIMRTQKAEQPLDVLAGELFARYFPAAKGLRHPLRYYANYRYFEYSELNYLNSAPPYREALIEQDSLWPDPQQPEDWVLLGTYAEDASAVPALDPARVPEGYEVVLAQANDVFVQMLARRLPYPRQAVPLRIWNGRHDVTRALQDKSSRTFVGPKNGELRLSRIGGPAANELVLYPRWGNRFPRDLSISVRVADPSAAPLFVGDAGQRPDYGGPISIPLAPSNAGEWRLTLRSSSPERLELGEIALFVDRPDDRSRFVEAGGAIINGSFGEETDGLPDAWTLDAFSKEGSPVLEPAPGSPGTRRLRFENKGAKILRAFQQADLREGFYALAFLAETSGSPSSYSQLEFLKKDEPEREVSSIEWIRESRRALYFKTFFLDKPAAARFNFYQFIPDRKGAAGRGVTWLSDVRLFRLEPAGN